MKIIEHNEDLPKNAAFAKKNSNINTLMIKIIITLKTIVFILVNTEVSNVAYLISHIKCLNKTPVVFLIDQIMISILS